MIGYKIKELRKKKKLTQAELGKIIGVSQTAITAWENDRTLPSREYLAKMARYFNVTSDYLLEIDKCDLDHKEKIDIALQAEKLIEGLENTENLNFYGEPATQEQKDRLLIAITTAMEMNKREAKSKFTPKKYRE